MKFVRHTALAVAAFAAISTGALAETTKAPVPAAAPSHAIQMSDAQLAKTTAAGAADVVKVDRTTTAVFNSGVVEDRVNLSQGRGASSVNSCTLTGCL